MRKIVWIEKALTTGVVSGFKSGMSSRGRTSHEAADYWFDMWCRTSRWQRALDEALADWDIRYTQYFLLRFIHRLERETHDAVMPQVLVDETQLDKSRVCRALQVLEEGGLIDRGPDGLDGRMQRLIITAAGRRLLSRTRSAMRAVAASMREEEKR